MVSDDRGQLILVGAVAIALVLLGLVLVVNTAVFTQVVGSEGTVETTRSGGVAAGELADALATTVAEENRQAGPSDNGGSVDNEIEDEIDGTESALGAALRDRSLESRGSFVSLEYDGNEDVGTRIAQEDVGSFADASGDPRWSPVALENRSDIGAFAMVIDTDESDFTSPFDVEVTGASGGSTELTLDEAASGDIELDVTGSTTASCSIEPTNDTVRIDVAAGRVYEDSSCQFDAFRDVEPGYVVEFRGGDAVQGTYELTISDDVSPLFNTVDPRFSTASDDPTLTTAVWSFAYRYEYDTDDATVESDRRVVNVYD